MMHHHETSLETMARQLLDALQHHGEVTLELSSTSEEIQALLSLITELHTRATHDQVRIRLTPLGERGLRFRRPSRAEPCSPKARAW